MNRDQLMQAADGHRGRGEFSAAETAYRQVLDADANDIEALAYLGGVLTDLGRIKDAVAVYERALRLAPDFAPFHTALGVARK